MKSFYQYLHEQSDPVPHGVLVYGDKIIVGTNHGDPVQITDKHVLNQVRSVGDKHGYSYEGTGGPVDIKQPLFGLNSKSDYRDGWDQNRSKTIRKNGVQPHHLSIIIGNVKENWKSINQHLGESGTVLDGLHRWANAVSRTAFGGAPVSRETVEQFLRKASTGTEKNFLETAKTTPVSQTKPLLHEMESIAWPENWNSKKRTTGAEKLVDAESEERNTHVLDNMSSGVYFAGAGHLKQIADTLKARGEPFTLHGGSKIVG